MAKDNGISNKVQLAVISNDIQYIKSEMHEIKSQITSSYVTKEEFLPVKKVVYGLVTIILLAVGAAIIKLAVK